MPWNSTIENKGTMAWRATFIPHLKESHFSFLIFRCPESKSLKWSSTSRIPSSSEVEVIRLLEQIQTMDRQENEFADTDLNNSIVDAIAEETDWMNEMGIEQEDPKIGPTEQFVDNVLANGKDSKAVASTESASTLSIAEELYRASDNHLSKVPIRYEVSLSQTQREETPPIDAMAGIVRTAGKDDSNSLSPFERPTSRGHDHESAKRMAECLSEVANDHEITELNQDRCPSRRLSQKGTLDRNTESSDTREDSESATIEEENPRLSRLEKWQQETWMSGTQDIASWGHHELGTVDDEFVEPQCTSGMIVDRASPCSTGGSTDQLETGTDVGNSVNTTAKMAAIENDQPLPKPIKTSIKPYASHTAFKSYLEIPGGLDITEAEETKFFPNPSRAQVVHNAEPGTDSPPQSRTSPKDPSLEGDILEKVLENCIRQTNSMLCNGRSKHTLSRSQEIARLMESVLTAHTQPLNMSEERRSLSDLVDSSAWRELCI